MQLDLGDIAKGYAPYAALTVMDPKKGIELINSLKKTEAIIFFQSEEGHLEWRSEGFSKILK